MKVCNPLTHSFTQSYMQVQYAGPIKRSSYTYAYTYYTYYIRYGRKLYIMLILYILYKIWSKTLHYVNCPLRLLDWLSLSNTLKGGLKLHYFICTKFWLVSYRFNMHKTKALRLYACTLCDHMFGSFYLVPILYSQQISVNKIHLILITLLTCMLN